MPTPPLVTCAHTPLGRLNKSVKVFPSIHLDTHTLRYNFPCRSFYAARTFCAFLSPATSVLELSGWAQRTRVLQFVLT